MPNRLAARRTLLAGRSPLKSFDAILAEAMKALGRNRVTHETEADWAAQLRIEQAFLQLQLFVITDRRVGSIELLW